MTRAEWYPGATQRPIAKWINEKKFTRGGTPPRTFITHVDAGGNASLYSFFSRNSVGCSHFFITEDGRVEQYMPISAPSLADVGARRHAVSVETSRRASNSSNTKWTAAQQEALAKLYAWLNVEWGIPFRLATYAGDSVGGIAGHRLGVTGNFPSSPYILRGRTQTSPQGRESWSGARGKICPCDANLLLLNKITARAAVLAGSPVSYNPSKPASSSNGRIRVDGKWGPNTTRKLQAYLKTPIDGVVSSQYVGYSSQNPGLYGGWDWVTRATGSTMMRELQRRVGSYTDGLIGPNTIRALQNTMGTPEDGVVSAVSTVVKALQRGLNSGNLPF